MTQQDLYIMLTWLGIHLLFYYTDERKEVLHSCGPACLSCVQLRRSRDRKM
jgi:hypothetical protein